MQCFGGTRHTHQLGLLVVFEVVQHNLVEFFGPEWFATSLASVGIRIIWRAAFALTLLAYDLGVSTCSVAQVFFRPSCFRVPLFASITRNHGFTSFAQQIRLPSVGLGFIIQAISVEFSMAKVLLTTIAMVEIYISCRTAFSLAAFTNQM